MAAKPSREDVPAGTVAVKRGRTWVAVPGITWRLHDRLTGDTVNSFLTSSDLSAAHRAFGSAPAGTSARHHAMDIASTAGGHVPRPSEQRAPLIEQVVPPELRDRLVALFRGMVDRGVDDILEPTAEEVARANRFQPAVLYMEGWDAGSCI